MDFNLAMLAGLAGLSASTIAVVGTAFLIRGLVARLIAQIVVTTVLSFLGFIALLPVLGFEIVPPKTIAGPPVPNTAGAEPP